jgi:hypothetical protein
MESDDDLLVYDVELESPANPQFSVEPIEEEKSFSIFDDDIALFKMILNSICIAKDNFFVFTNCFG